MPTREADFERVALCHSRSLLRVARRLTSDSSSAEDIVQQTFLLAWRGFHQLRPDTNARAWLFRILMNAFYAEARRMRRLPAVIELTAEVTVSFPDLDQAMDISRALDSLHIDHRTVLLLGVVEGFTCAEISEILSVPIGTVMSRLSRARRTMRTLLAAPLLLTSKDPS